jgi:hypothetical protein
MFTEQSLRQYPEVVKAFTGIPSERFWAMLKEMAEQAAAYCKSSDKVGQKRSFVKRDSPIIHRNLSWRGGQ